MDPERKKRFISTSSRVIRRLYGPGDGTDGGQTALAGEDAAARIGRPGEYPFTRGVHPTMYRGKPWTMRMFAGFGTAQESNERLRYLLEQGQTGLSIAFDLPTLMGLDSDDPMAEGEFGKCGTAISSLRDMERLLEGIPLDRVSTSMTINSPAAIVWAMYIVAAEKQGVRPEQLRGTTQNDILKEFIAQKEYLFPPRESMRLVTDTVEYGTRHLPLWNSISISGYHIREAGSTAGQELAFTLLDGMEYVRWAVDRGLAVDDFAPRLSFFFNAHNDLFEEVAKYRAARRIWARKMREEFGAQDQRSWLMRFHTQTAGCSLTAAQPLNNIARVTVQALAAVLGGTQSLHTNSMDEAIALPSREAVTVALRTQQILLEESGAANTVDPLGGSYYVESLTNSLEEEAEQIFARVAALGGVLPALEQGYFQREIAAAAYDYQRQIDSGERVVVGVNGWQSGEGGEIPALRMDPYGYSEQVKALGALRSERDNIEVGLALDELRSACAGSENCMPAILRAVRAYATLGEMTAVMKEVFGGYEEPAWM